MTTAARRAGALQPASAAQLVSATGAVTICIDGGPTLPIDADVVAAALRGSPQLQTVTLDDGSYRLLTEAWHEGGVLQLARNLDEVDDVLTTLRFRLIAVAGAGIALGQRCSAGWSPGGSCGRSCACATPRSRSP